MNTPLQPEDNTIDVYASDPQPVISEHAEFKGEERVWVLDSEDEIVPSALNPWSNGTDIKMSGTLAAWRAYIAEVVAQAESRGYQRGLEEAKHYLTMPGETITVNGKKYRKEQYVTLKESLKKGLDK